MKIGDLIQHRGSKKIAIIIEEIGPYNEKPYYYYKLLWTDLKTTTAPLKVLIKLWEVISEA
mgnify:CR=1 FL=1